MDAKPAPRFAANADLLYARIMALAAVTGKAALPIAAGVTALTLCRPLVTSTEDTTLMSNWEENWEIERQWTEPQFIEDMAALAAKMRARTVTLL